MNTVRTVLAALAAGLALMVVTFSAQAQIKDPNETLRVTFIIHCCEGNAFWEPLLHGAREAAELHNVDIDFQNADNDAERNRNLIITAIANKVDGIVAMDPVEGALTDAIQQARDAGISVMTSNVDDPQGGGTGGTARIAYVGAKPFNQAYLMAKTLIDKYGLGEGDHCLVPAHDPSLHHIEQRILGVNKALDEHGITSDPLHVGLIIDEVTSFISEYLVAHPETDCVACTGCQGTVPQAIEEAGLDRLPNGDVDVNPRVMANIKDGLTDAVADQQPFWQGFMPVVFIAYNVRYGLIPGDMDTSAGLVSEENAIYAETYAVKYR
jgi:simple sugar transport system substrate-binding protein